MGVTDSTNLLATRTAEEFNAVRGEISDQFNGSLVVTKMPLYEYRELWAEEAGAINSNQAEWSYGNGSTGFVGVPIDAGWEAIEMGFSADGYAATATVTVELVVFLTASNNPANTVASLSLADSTDGGGATNHAWKHEVLSVPKAIPAGPLGFYTRSVSGTISDARVYARMRRQIGEYVTGVQIA